MNNALVISGLILELTKILMDAQTQGRDVLDEEVAKARALAAGQKLDDTIASKE